MHGKRQSWGMVALRCGVVTAILVLLLPLLPVRIFGLSPYWLSLGLGLWGMVYVLMRNPALRSLRTASMLIGILGAANTLPAFNLTILSEWGGGHWSQDGAFWHLNMELIGLLFVLFVLDYFTNHG